MTEEKIWLAVGITGTAFLSALVGIYLVGKPDNNPMTQDNGMTKHPPVQVDETHLNQVARAVSRELEGSEIYWKDYVDAARASICSYERVKSITVLRNQP